MVRITVRVCLVVRRIPVGNAIARMFSFVESVFSQNASSEDQLISKRELSKLALDRSHEKETHY